VPSRNTHSDHLLLTARGEQWLKNFDEVDRITARDLASALSLVSHNEFERGLTSLVRQVAETVNGPIALYGARELPTSFRFESAEGDEFGSIDATPRGGDIGSEGRIASVIRNLSLEQPSKLLNHPTLQRLRETRADAVLVLDDYIGSGKRTTDYLTALWKPSSVKSWVSYKRMRFMAAAYSATARGMRRVEAHACHPVTHLVRHCPTIASLHWNSARIEAAKQLCRDYARRAALGRFAMGFQDTGALLVFEHGCPNNAPAIFWATSKREPKWAPLFPAKRVDSSIATAFPPEIVRRDPVHVLLEAGQMRLASALAFGAHRPLSDSEALVLALFARGRHRIETIADATGLSAADAARMLERCIEAGWISPRMRITDAGLAEIRGMRLTSMRRLRPIPQLGEDLYYPGALRDRGNG